MNVSRMKELHSDEEAALVLEARCDMGKFKLEAMPILDAEAEASKPSGSQTRPCDSGDGWVDCALGGQQFEDRGNRP